VAELQQRYTHAKQAMKQAQERLDAHSRRKEELMRQQRKNNDTAIIAESNHQFYLHSLRFVQCGFV